MPKQKPAKEAPPTGRPKPTRAEVKEAIEKLKGPEEFPKGPKPLYKDVKRDEVVMAMQPTKQGKKDDKKGSDPLKPKNAPASGTGKFSKAGRKK